MKAKAIHFNPDDERRYRGKTQCGEQLAKVQHSTNPDHVNCGRCLRSMEAARTWHRVVLTDEMTP